MPWKKIAAFILAALAIGFHVTFCRGGTNLGNSPVLVLHFEDIDAADVFLYRGVFTANWCDPRLAYLFGAALPLLLLAGSLLLLASAHTFRFTKITGCLILLLISFLSAFPEAYGPIPIPLILPLYSVFITPDWIVPFVPFLTLFLIVAWVDRSRVKTRKLRRQESLAAKA